MKIDGVEAPSTLRFVDCDVDGTDGSWDIDAGSASYSLIGSRLGQDGNWLILGDLEAVGELKAGLGLALGNAEDIPQGFPGAMKKAILLHDPDGNELGYLVTYEAS